MTNSIRILFLWCVLYHFLQNCPKIFHCSLIVSQDFLNLQNSLANKFYRIYYPVSRHLYLHISYDFNQVSRTTNIHECSYFANFHKKLSIQMSVTLDGWLATDVARDAVRPNFLHNAIVPCLPFHRQQRMPYRSAPQAISPYYNIFPLF